jgi:hypothetical protein
MDPPLERLYKEEESPHSKQNNTIQDTLWWGKDVD